MAKAKSCSRRSPCGDRCCRCEPGTVGRDASGIHSLREPHARQRSLSGPSGCGSLRGDPNPGDGSQRGGCALARRPGIRPRRPAASGPARPTFSTGKSLPAQPAAFVIRVLAELGDNHAGMAWPRRVPAMPWSTATAPAPMALAKPRPTMQLRRQSRGATEPPTQGGGNRQPAVRAVLARRRCDLDVRREPAGRAFRAEKDLPTWPKQFSMSAGRGLPWISLAMAAGRSVVATQRPRGPRLRGEDRFHGPAHRDYSGGRNFLGRWQLGLAVWCEVLRLQPR